MRRFAIMVSWKARDLDWVAIALAGDVGQLRPFQAERAALGQRR
jgi:hypothetical protein